MLTSIIYLGVIVIATIIALWLIGQLAVAAPTQSMIKNVIIVIALLLVVLVLLGGAGIPFPYLR